MPSLTFTFQEASPLIAYTGGWDEGNHADGYWVHYDGSFRLSNSTGAKASLSFVGTAVNIFGALRPNHGNYSVDLDHTTVVPSLSGSGRETFKYSLWSVDSLENTEHTVEFTNKPASTGSYVDLDYITIEREIGQANDTIFNATLDDTSQFVRYTGTWDSSPTVQSQQHNGTIHRTTAGNSQLVVTFQGCCIELYGLYANAAYTVGVDMNPPVHMQGLDLDLREDLWHPETLLYLKDGLPENATHTVTLTTSNASTQRPFFFDYAIARGTNNFTSPITPFAAQSSFLSSSHTTPVGLIVVIAIGGVVLVALAVTIYLILRRRQKRRYSARVMIESDPWVSSDQTRFSAAIPPSHVVVPPVVAWRRASGEGLNSFTDSKCSRENLDMVTNQRAESQREGIVFVQEEDAPGSLPPAYNPAWGQI